MITKVTSANYNDYTLLFNQADTALKKFSGEPTTEFIEIKAPIGDVEDDDYQAGDAFDSTIQYFDESYIPVSFENTADFNARNLSKKWYKLNEQIIYDLDTYFGRLKVLADIDYSFLRMPIDEPTFDIVDGGNSGRRVINIPDEFASGISVQGDETAEILFFSIDRYYDATDLWTTDMNYVIQWKTATKNGVTKAFINKDGRPFLENGKLYFGWPISSEITKEAGNVVFSVRIFKFGEGLDAEDKPKLAFGLNTQTATVKINESIAFDIKSATEFEDAETVNKTPDIISRIFNSTVMSETQQEASPKPTLIKNILPYTEEQLASMAIKVVTIPVETYTLATGDFDATQTYYNGNHEVVTGLNTNIFRPGFYYTKTTEDQKFYEFDYNDIYEDIQQIQAIAPSGVITYSGASCAEPGSNTIGGRLEVITGDEVVFIPVTSDTVLLNHKYYEKDETTGKYIVAQNIKTTLEDEEWAVEDRNMSAAGHPCKYYERVSPILRIDSTAPVGCYWLVAYNNEAKKAMSSTDSYKIWIPGPVDLVDPTNINDEGKSFDDEHKVRVLLDANRKAKLDVDVIDVANRNTVKYNWYKKVNGEFVLQTDLASIDEQEVIYPVNGLSLVDDTYKVEFFTTRNRKDSNAKLSREFRITDIAHKFVFDTVADTADEEAHPTDNVKVVARRYNQPDAYDFKIDFSENLDEDDKLKMVSDKVAYRYKRRTPYDTVANIFLNDTAASNWTSGTDFEITTYDELKDRVFTIPEDNQYFYVEVINIVNEDFDLDALNAAAAAVAAEQTIATTSDWAPFEARIARTPYMLVRA